MLKEAFKTCFAFTKPTTVRYIIRLDMEWICMRNITHFYTLKLGEFLFHFSTYVLFAREECHHFPNAKAVTFKKRYKYLK